ncbi:MAG: hypothetical protein ACRD0S_04355 [Acidimicrobiales bacterium]
MNYGGMDASLVAGYIALALCIPLVLVVFGLRLRNLLNLLNRGNRPGSKRPPKLPPRDPYHIP